MADETLLQVVLSRHIDPPHTQLVVLFACEDDSNSMICRVSLSFPSFFLTYPPPLFYFSCFYCLFSITLSLNFFHFPLSCLFLTRFPHPIFFISSLFPFPVSCLLLFTLMVVTSFFFIFSYLFPLFIFLLLIPLPSCFFLFPFLLTVQLSFPSLLSFSLPICTPSLSFCSILFFFLMSLVASVHLHFVP